MTYFLLYFTAVRWFPYENNASITRKRKQHTFGLHLKILKNRKNRKKHQRDERGKTKTHYRITLAHKILHFMSKISLQT